MATAVPPSTATEPRRPVILPSRGVARVKSVLSGDTVILLGKASGPDEKAPEVIFTLENISAPRYVLKLSVSIFLRIRWMSLTTDPLNK
jgi:hypothetical protein